MPPEYRARIEASRPLLQKRAREQYGLELNAGPSGIDSRPALVAEKFAIAEGKGETFHKAVMQAYWQEASAIDDRGVLKEIAESVGLHTDNFSSVLENSTFDAEVSSDIALAEEYGLTGVPALVFDNTYLVMGAQPYDVLKNVVERVQNDR
jgi:predicted DsbA family dithiol-disulfide isomerase